MTTKPKDQQDEAPERAEIAEAPTADMDAEFPTPWHRDAYIDGLEREIASGNLRVVELTGLDAHPDAIAAAEEQIVNAQSELDRLTKSKKKSA